MSGSSTDSPKKIRKVKKKKSKIRTKTMEPYLQNLVNII